MIRIIGRMLARSDMPLSEVEQCRERHSAMVQSIILLGVLLLISVVLHVLFWGGQGFLYLRLTHDINAALVGAQLAVVTYRAIKREQCI